MRFSIGCPVWARGPVLALAASLAVLLVPSGAGAAPGDLLVLDKTLGTGKLIGVDPETGARSAVSTNSAPGGEPPFGDPAGVAMAPDGTIFVAEEDGSVGPNVMRVDPATGARALVSYNSVSDGQPELDLPSDIVIAADGTILITDTNAFADGGGGIFRIEPDTGARTTLSSNDSTVDLPQFATPVSLAVAANGDVIVVDQDAYGGAPGLIRVDAETGYRSTISRNGAPFSGPELVNPIGVAIAPDGGILVADRESVGSLTRVIRVDPQSGTRTIVSSNIAPFGEPSLVNPRAVALTATGDLVVAEADAFGGPGGMIRIDPLSGARTDISRNGVPAGGPSFSDPSDVVVEPGDPPSTPAPPGPPTAEPPPSAPADTVVPQISSLSLTNPRFRVGTATSPAAASRAPVGTRFAYTLSEAAAVTITMERALPGRRVGGRCLRPTPNRRKRPRCTRFAPPSATLVRQNAAGTNRIRFTGRTARGALRPGRYRARIHATDAAGNRSALRSVRFRVVPG